MLGFLRESQTLFSWIVTGGWVMIPLSVCSCLTWIIVLERFWSYFQLQRRLQSFPLEATNILLQRGTHALHEFCHQNKRFLLADIISTGLDRFHSENSRFRESWVEVMDRRRQVLTSDLKRHLWILGTIGAAAPFIGLLGTVLGILRTFQEIAHSGASGFAVVASGISESLVATAAGILVAVVALITYNTLQVGWMRLVLKIRIQLEELIEIVDAAPVSFERRPPTL